MENNFLTELANQYQCDKGNQFGEGHGYTEIYHSYLHKIRNDPLNIFEIGMCHTPYFAGVSEIFSPSLQMWSEYFPVATIYGLDIKDFSSLNSDRVHIFQGDQGDTSFMQKLQNKLPLLDVVFDDGSHSSSHQQTSFRYLFPLLSVGGYYFIEDLHWQPDVGPDLPTSLNTRELFKSQLMNDAFDIQFFCNDKLMLVRKTERVSQFWTVQSFEKNIG